MISLQRRHTHNEFGLKTNPLQAFLLKSQHIPTLIQRRVSLPVKSGVSHLVTEHVNNTWRSIMRHIPFI